MIGAADSARPLRGRRTELATIGMALGRAAEGHPTAVALVGEPGIGKSRLANEAAAIAEREGFATRWGRAWEAGGAPAYWPWRQLCEGLDRDGAIAQLWSGRASGATDPDQARFELFDAVSRALAQLADTQPVLCILDDLHAADVPSLELIAFAARHLRGCRLAWLLSWRDAEGSQMPVRDQLVRIAHEATVVPLAPLPEVEANELIDDVFAEANIELRHKLIHATAGNPLFLLETLAALAVGQTVHTDERLPLAQGIAAIVNERLAPLPPASRRLAEAAAVVGRDVALWRWAAAAACDPELVRREAPALAATGVLAECGRDHWRFGHDLVREAIYRAAGDGAAEIHGRIARALDAEIAAGDDSLTGERAHHGLLARIDERTAIDWTIAAADHAGRQCAFEEALAAIDRAMAVLGPSAQRDAALQLARGRALLDLNDADGAREALVCASSLARKADDPCMLATVALALGARYVLGDRPHDLIAMIDEAMAALPESESVLRARLLARKAAALTPAPLPEPVLAMARRAQRDIADVRDEAVRLEVAVAVGSAFADFAHPRERIPVNEEVVALARARGDRALELRGLSRLVTDHLQAGDFGAADAVLETRDSLARALVQPRFAWMEPLFRSMRGMTRGDFAACDAAVAEAAAFADHDPNVVRACAVHRTYLLLYSDRVDELRAHEPTVLDAIRTMRTDLQTLIRAVIRLRSGERAEARREVDALAPDLANSHGTPNLVTLAEVAAEVGSESMQEKVYELLAPLADTYSGWGLFALAIGPPIAASLGLLAGARGDCERAIAHFDAALAMTTAVGASVGRAWSGYWYGRTLVRLGDGDAARVLDEAERDASRLGMGRLVQRCRDAHPAHAAAPAPRAPASEPRLAWSMAEHAGSWRVTVADRSFLVPNLRGMALLARLAATPHVEVHSLELVSGSARAEVDAGDAGEHLDDQARAAYRQRVSALDEAIEDAEARGDAARYDAATRERDALIKELSRAVGLGGKVRRAGAASERARVTAQRRLRDAIRRITELDEELGAHLDQAVRTGMYCVYRPSSRG